MDALLEKPAKGGALSLELVRKFLAGIRQCEERRHPSVGYGTDWRYEGKDLVGSVLVHVETVVHLAFFRVEAGDRQEPFAPFSRRRGYRRSADDLARAPAIALALAIENISMD